MHLRICMWMIIYKVWLCSEHQAKSNKSLNEQLEKASPKHVGVCIANGPVELLFRVHRARLPLLPLWPAGTLRTLQCWRIYFIWFSFEKTVVKLFSRNIHISFKNPPDDPSYTVPVASFEPPIISSESVILPILFNCDDFKFAGWYKLSRENVVIQETSRAGT